MRSKPARSQGGAGGAIPLLVSPQVHSACNKIYVQELDPSLVGAPRLLSSFEEERNQWLPLAARPG